MHLSVLALLLGPFQSPGSGTLTLESLDGREESRPAASFQTSDPRELGAYVIVFPVASGAPVAPGTRSAQVLLQDGERWIGNLTGVSAEEIQVELGQGASARASIDELRSITLPEHLPAEWTGTLSHPSEGDRLYRLQGRALDVIDGAVESFASEGVRFHGTRIESKLFAWSEIAAVLIESVGTQPAAGSAPAAGVPVLVDLVNGSRLRGGLKACAQGKLELAVLRGQALTIPFAEVRQLFVDDGRARYLSDLAPAQAEVCRPFGDDLGLSWTHQIDHSVSGRPLRAGGRTFGHGIGVHAPSKLSWRLESGWKTLRGRVAVDDEVLTALRARLGRVPHLDRRQARLGEPGGARRRAAARAAGDRPGPGQGARPGGRSGARFLRRGPRGLARRAARALTGSFSPARAAGARRSRRG
jgi:hypothetical protein